jgi:dephospho-CoA kinase
MPKEVIGIIGTIGAGKDTAGDYIAEKLQIPSFQISYPLKQICAEINIEPTRENLIALGTKLATEYGDGYLAEYILKRVPEKAVITGMRQLGQITTLRSSSNLKLISINAAPSIRFERIKNTGKLGEASTLEEFITREQAENDTPNAQRLFECMKLVDYHVTNDTSLEELYAQLDEIIDK